MLRSDGSSARISPRAWVVFGAMCAIFGTTFLAIRVGSMAGAPPFLAAATRFIVAGLVVIGARGKLHQRSNWPSAAYMWRVAVLGSLIIGFSFAATYLAAQFIASGLIAQIQAVSPVMVAFLSVLVLRVTIARGQRFGLALGLVGTALLIGSVGRGGTGAVWGALAAFGAEITFSLGSIWYRKAFPKGTDSILTNGYSMLVGGTLLLGLALATGQTSIPRTLPAVGSIAYLIVFGSIGAHSMYLWLIANVSPVFASTWLYISPVIATALGAMVLGETITIANVVGAAAVFGGVYLIQRTESDRNDARGDEAA